MFDPYHKWLGIPPRAQPPNHYRLLGIDLFESDPEVIDAAANRQMAYLQQRATGEHGARSQELLGEIAAARLCLLDAEKRREYDEELRQFEAKANQPQEKPPAAPSPAKSGTSAPVRPAEMPPPQVHSSEASRRSWKAERRHIAAGIGIMFVAALAGLVIRSSKSSIATNAPASKTESSSESVQGEPVPVPVPIPVPTPYPGPFASPYPDPFANPYTGPYPTPYPGPYSDPFSTPEFGRDGASISLKWAEYTIQVFPANTRLRVRSGRAVFRGSGTHRTAHIAGSEVLLEATCDGYSTESKWLKPNEDQDMSVSFSLPKLDATVANEMEDEVAIYAIELTPAHLDLEVVDGEAEIAGLGGFRRVTLSSRSMVRLKATCVGYEPKMTWLRPSLDESREVQLSLAEIEKKEVPVTIVQPTVVPAKEGEKIRVPSSQGEIVRPKPATPVIGELPAPVEVTELPFSIRDVVAGKGGRCLVLHMPEELAIYDVVSATIADKLTIPADAMVAAGLSNVIVASPSERTVRCYEIEDLAEGRTRSIPIAGAIKAVALGYASRGPLLVFWAPDGNRVTKAVYTLLEVPALGAIRIDGVVKHHSGYPTKTTRPVARGTVSLEHNSDRDLVHLRASGSGQVFGLWRVGTSPNGLETLVLDGALVVDRYQHDSVGHVVPNADGTFIGTETGLYRVDLAGKRGDQACIPSYHADYYLTVPLPVADRDKSRRSERLTIRRTESGEPILEFLKPEEMASLKAQEWPKRDLTLDKRYHLFPEAGRLITIPEGNGKLIVRQVDLGITEAVEGDSDQDAESLSVKSRPNREAREWTDKSGKFRVTATFVSVAAGRVKLRKANGEVITVEFDKLSETDVAYIKEIGR